MASIIDGDLTVRGTLRTNSFAPPANSIGNTEFDATDPLDATKQQHQYVLKYAQDDGAVVATKTSPIHTAHAAGTLVALVASLKTPCVGAATVVVDLLKNGTTVLSGTITLDSGESAYATVDATFASTAYAAGDNFDVRVTATAGGGTIGQRLGVFLTVREDAD